MNKHILTVALTGLALTGFCQIASAHDEDEDNPQQGYQQSYDPRYADPRYVDPRNADPRHSDHQEFDHRGGGLEYEVDHLNRMVAHVQGELRQYGADRHMLREYQHVRDEAYQVSNQFRRGEQYYNRRRLRAQIEHMHNELHHIEQELHVPANAWYRWR